MFETLNRRRRCRPKTDAMRAKVNEAPCIKSKMDDVAEPLAAVKQGLIHAAEQAADSRRRYHPPPDERPRPVDPLTLHCPRSCTAR